MGEKFVENFFQKTLDKIAIVWYNGEYGSFAVANEPGIRKEGWLPTSLIIYQVFHIPWIFLVLV